MLLCWFIVTSIPTGHQRISGWAPEHLGTASQLTLPKVFTCACVRLYVCVSVCALQLEQGGGSMQHYNLRHHSVWKSLRDPSHPSHFSQGSCPDSLIAGRLPEETHGLFKHSQTLGRTPPLPGEHFLYPHVTCHKICLTHAATDSRSRTGSAIRGDSVNSPTATYCLLSDQCRLPSNLIQAS